ncbi:MAG: outer membrane homotrimeric porin [Desulfovibrio sp.]|nr:outer membrane homotrimeric porin [Desulfovibrio sp.]
MKKIATLVLAAGLVLSAVTGAQAIDFKAKGQWIMSFDYGQNGSFADARGWGQRNTDQNQDDFEAMQRIRLQLDAVASEALSGTVFFEIGDTIWGQDSTGGALGADGKIVEVKRAYIDWMPPQTDLKVRMGIQGMALPSFTTGSTVLNGDVAGITASYKFTDNVSLTALWARPYNDNGGVPTKGGTPRSGYNDNFDAFALLLPMTFDGVKVTPWAMFAFAGNGILQNEGWGSEGRFFKAGFFPAGGALHNDGGIASDPNASSPRPNYATAWWGGLTGDITMFDPFRFAWDFTYGSVDWDHNSRYNRAGWLLSGLFEYKMDWGIPGIVGWYASGDDGNPSNGSERLPTIDANNTNQFSNFAFDGDPYIARDSVIGNGMGGTWGVGARVRDMSFVEDLKHTFRVNLIGGTNAPKMGRKLAENGIYANGFDPYYRDVFGNSVGMEAMYLTTEDTALEVGLTNTYQMYENFLINFDASYVAMWLEDRADGRPRVVGKDMNNKVYDAWNLNLAFVYSF